MFCAIMVKCFVFIKQNKIGCRLLCVSQNKKKTKSGLAFIFRILIIGISCTILFFIVLLYLCVFVLVIMTVLMLMLVVWFVVVLVNAALITFLLSSCGMFYG